MLFAFSFLVGSEQIRLHHVHKGEDMAKNFRAYIRKVESYGEKMQKTMENKNKKRAASRNPTEATITCRPFTSSGDIHTSDGVMRNFSSEGSYIETSHNYGSGTVLILRTVRYPSMPSSMADEEQPRSICLAEVKWRQELAGENAIRFGMGLRYLD